MQGLHCIAIEKTGLENFVLQYTSLYCRLGGVVLQYCIVIGRLAGKICIALQKLYCDSRDSGLLDCVVTQGHDIAIQATTRRWGQAGQALGAQLGSQGARGARRRAYVGRAGGCCRQLGARARGTECWARARAGRAGVGAAGRRWAQAWARGALGVSARGARRGRVGRTGRAAWACLCAWWACWLG